VGGVQHDWLGRPVTALLYRRAWSLPPGAVDGAHHAELDPAAAAGGSGALVVRRRLPFWGHRCTATVARGTAVRPPPAPAAAPVVVGIDNAAGCVDMGYRGAAGGGRAESQLSES
jgi:hypothetical protein